MFGTSVVITVCPTASSPGSANVVSATPGADITLTVDEIAN